MTKLYQIKHDQCNSKNSSPWVCQSLGQVPTYPIQMNYECSSALNKFISFIKNGIRLPNDCKKDKLSNDIPKILWVMNFTRMEC